MWADIDYECGRMYTKEKHFMNNPNENRWEWYKQVYGNKRKNKI